eukprot:5467436-Pleurochrysis_carterae.AAC.2
MPAVEPARELPARPSARHPATRLRGARAARRAAAAARSPPASCIASACTPVAGAAPARGCRCPSCPAPGSRPPITALCTPRISAVCDAPAAAPVAAIPGGCHQRARRRGGFAAPRASPAPALVPSSCGGPPEATARVVGGGRVCVSFLSPSLPYSLPPRVRLLRGARLRCLPQCRPASRGDVHDVHVQPRPLRLRAHRLQLVGVAEAVSVTIRLPGDRHPPPLLAQLPRAPQQRAHLCLGAGCRLERRPRRAAVPDCYHRSVALAPCHRCRRRHGPHAEELRRRHRYRGQRLRARRAPPLRFPLRPCRRAAPQHDGHVVWPPFRHHPHLAWRIRREHVAAHAVDATRVRRAREHSLLRHVREQALRRQRDARVLLQQLHRRVEECQPVGLRAPSPRQRRRLLRRPPPAPRRARRRHGHGVPTPQHGLELREDLRQVA